MCVYGGSCRKYHRAVKLITLAALFCGVPSHEFVTVSDRILRSQYRLSVLYGLCLRSIVIQIESYVETLDL